jgi:transposase-like protein
MSALNLSDPIFHNEDKAREHLEKIRWPNGPYCPHCGNADQTSIHKLNGKSHRPGLYQCNACREHFTVTVGSVMERSHIPLSKWVLGFHLMNASKKGMSAHQLHRMLGITYKSAWFMAHRIREAMRDDAPDGMGGPGKAVQADETYYGATSKRAKAARNRPRYKHGDKAIVVGLVDPSTGAARGFHIKEATGDTIRDILFRHVHRTSTLVSDESNLYRYTGKAFAMHSTVTHWKAEYVNADGFTTNNVENFFGVFKKGMTGVYHFCAQKHLQRYLDEFSFRYTYRAGVGVNDAERAALAIKGAAGKRLTYRGPHNTAHA